MANSTVKLKSSFPGILQNIPEVRSQPFALASDWLEEKRRTDNIGDLWRVHDKLYNFDEFIQRHPGGEEWLEITKGTDITEAFEASHIVNFTLVENILGKYYIRDATSPRNSPYTFKPDGFYKTVKRRIEPILKVKGTGPNRNVLLIQDTLALAFLSISFLGVWINSTLVQLVAGLLLSFSVIASHNSNHSRLVRSNWRRFYFDLSLFPSCEWRISHVLSHHAYPNTLMDAEISLFEPFFQFLPISSKNWMQRYGSVIYAHLLYPFFFGSVFFIRLARILNGKAKFRPENAIVIAQLIVYLFLAPSFMSALWSWFFIQDVASYYFALVGVYASHHHNSTFHDGDEARTEPDFGLCQLDATRERHDDVKNIFFVLTSFGEHPLHHLYPTICHSKLNFIKKIIEDTILEYSEDLKPPISKWEMFKGTHEQLARIKPNKLSKKPTSNTTTTTNGRDREYNNPYEKNPDTKLNYRRKSIPMG